MRRRQALLIVFWGLMMSGAARAAPPIQLLICQPGGPDLSEHEQTILGRMLRYLERKTELAEGRIVGTYENTPARCEKELEKRPHLLFSSLPIYLTYKDKLGLKPLVQVAVEGGIQDRYYVLVSKKGPVQSKRPNGSNGLNGLEGLKGQLITGTHLMHPDFIAKVVLEGRAGSAGELKLEPARQGLRAIRSVTKGRAAAVVLDGVQYRSLKGTRYDGELRVLHESAPLPTAPISTTKEPLPPGLASKLTQALSSMTVDPEGQEVIKLYRIEGFKPAVASRWSELEAKLKSTP